MEYQTSQFLIFHQVFFLKLHTFVLKRNFYQLYLRCLQIVYLIHLVYSKSYQPLYYYLTFFWVHITYHLGLNSRHLSNLIFIILNNFIKTYFYFVLSQKIRYFKVFCMILVYFIRFMTFITIMYSRKYFVSKQPWLMIERYPFFLGTGACLDNSLVIIS